MKRTRLLVENDLETDASFIHFLQHYYHHLSSTTPDKHEARRETRGGKCENVGVYKRGERENTWHRTLSLRLPNLEEHSRSLDTSLPALASSLCSHTLQSTSVSGDERSDLHHDARSEDSDRKDFNDVNRQLMGRESSEPAQPLTILGVLVTVCDMFSLLLRGVLQEQHSLLTRAIEALCGQITEKSSDSVDSGTILEFSSLWVVARISKIPTSPATRFCIHRSSRSSRRWWDGSTTKRWHITCILPSTHFCGRKLGTQLVADHASAQRSADCTILSTITSTQTAFSQSELSLDWYYDTLSDVQDTLGDVIEEQTKESEEMTVQIEKLGKMLLSVDKKLEEKPDDTELLGLKEQMRLLTQLRTLEKAKIAENVEIQDLVNQKAEDAETKPTAEHPQDASDANDSQTPKRLDSEHSSKDTSAEPESGPAPQHLSRLHSASFSSWIWDAHDPPACERGFAWLIFKPVLAVCIVGDSAVEGAEGKNGVSGEVASDLCRETAIACIDSLLFFDTELMTNQLIGALLDELPVSLKKGTAVQHRYKLVFGHLRTEGLSDALELHLIIHQSRSFILSVPATRYITHKTLSEKQERTALIRVIRSGSLDEKAGGSSESGRIAEEQICMAEDALSEHDIRLNRLNTILRLVEKWIKMAKTLAKQPPPQSTPRPSPSERKALQTQFLAIAGTAPVTIPPILKAEQEMITLEGNQPLEPDVPSVLSSSPFPRNPVQNPLLHPKPYPLEGRIDRPLSLFSLENGISTSIHF
ncbi:hypothetical protein BLNAU_13601 [Blattamonas nauphoetae]|uniref:Uncharacterized protein n=1 Tax=Blattamonas nauphoetae TaxID=2049346 RepID=A0ABQ9XKT4_9EUKA|nr:hypothetical protein BLNAU_13601 [Blattamonas nauphoetae]